MIRLICLGFALALVAFNKSADDPQASDLATMQGDWMVNSMVAAGAKVPDDEAQVLFRSVKGEQYSVSRYSRSIAQGTLKIDARKNPKTIDSTPAGTEDLAKRILGIYEFDGRQLKICNAAPGKPRPTNFDAQLGSGHTTIIWEPEKK